MRTKDYLKQQILKKVQEYYSKTQQAKPDFVPGKTRINYAGRVFNQEELINLVDSSLEFWLTYGRYSQQFEDKFAAFIGVKHCALVNSGSSANLLAFMALTSDELGKRKIYRKDEVITVAAGFPTTIAPVIQYGAIPVFVDVNPDTYNVDVTQLKKALSKRTKAVILAHTLGNPFDLNAVIRFCRDNGLWLIEDNCDALGSKYNNKFTGSFGDIATSSFFPAHHITTGEGGAVYTNNSLLAKIILSLRDWGRDCQCPAGKDNTCGKRFSLRAGKLPKGYDHKYIYSHFGYNLRATDMQAAIGCAQLKKLNEFIQKRNDNFNHLYTGLKPAEKSFLLPIPTAKSRPCWFGFILTLKKNAGFTRNKIVNFLENNKIQTRFLFAGNIIRQPCFDSMRKSRKDYRAIGALKNTDYIMKNSFWFGVYPGMNKLMIETIINKINTFVKNNGKI